MKTQLKTMIALGVVSLFAAVASASVEITCDVERRGTYGYERAVRREVQFATGSELNRATRSVAYSSFKEYALLWFSQTEVAILEHRGTTFGISGDFVMADLPRLFSLYGHADFRQVNGSSATDYRITCKQYGRWIDPRVR